MPNQHDNPKADKMELEVVNSVRWVATHDEIYTEKTGCYICSCENPLIAGLIAEEHNRRLINRPLEC